MNRMRTFSRRTIGLLVVGYSTLLGVTLARDCSIVSEKLKKCLVGHSVDEILYNFPYINDILMLDVFCKNVECILACFDISIGTCSSMLLYFTYDIGSYKSSYRALCRNQNATVMAFKNCLHDVETVGRECFVPFREESYEIVLKYYNHPTAYVDKKCRSLQNLSNCLATEPMPGCTEEYVTLVNNVLKTFFLKQKCEMDSTATILWDNGPIQCGCKGIFLTFWKLFEIITVLLMLYYFNVLAL